MKNNRLEVGDVIYGVKDDKVILKLIVDRVTKMFAISRQWRFKKLVLDNNYVQLHGEDDWCSRTYWLASPELEKRYQHTQMVRTINDKNINDLDNETLAKICKILKDAKK